MGTLVAVDAQNLYYSAKRAGGKLDFQKLWSAIQGQETEFLAVVYLVKGDFDSSGFENLLRGIGYRLSCRVAERVYDGTRFKLKYDSNEIRIALEAVTKYLQQYEKFILVSGDVDYSDLFTTLREIGKQTEYWSFDRMLCSSMTRSVGSIHFLENLLLKQGAAP